MVRFLSDNLDLAQICNSGQCFRMLALGEEDNIEGQQAFRILAAAGDGYDKYLKAAQNGNEIILDCSENEFETFWKNYFDLQTDYAGIIGRIDNKDAYLVAASEMGSGIRILRQNLWEMIISFLISQQNNIPRIRKCIDNICRAYGNKCVAADGTEYYSFPTPHALAGLEEDALMECNLGYRSKYVVRTARQIAAGEYNPESIARMGYDEARDVLLSMYGVGKKVADCILLFALHYVDAFPIDTHIKQVLDREYAAGFPFDRYEGCAGIIQQYIFYYELQLAQALKN